MPLRDLLCVAQTPNAAPTPAFHQALAFARAAGAHLSVLLTAPRVLTPYSPLYASLAEGLVKSENDKTFQNAEAVKAVIEDATKIAGVAHDVAVIQEIVDDMTHLASRRARACELAVTDRPSDMLDAQEAFVEALLFRSGRPIVVVPPDRKPVAEVKCAVIAWDGSAHAARAAGDALGIFGAIERVEILAVVGEKDLSKSLAGADYARHVSRRGFTAVLADRPAEGGSVAAAIDRYAFERGADLIVMGGFGHSRWREFVFGGVTKDLLQSARTPILMAH